MGLLSADDEGEAKRGGGNSACRGWGTGALSQARFLLTPDDGRLHWVPESS